MARGSSAAGLPVGNIAIEAGKRKTRGQMSTACRFFTFHPCPTALDWRFWRGTGAETRR
ncbi:hypothetical protein OCEANICA350_12884 [Oceanicaulis sp. 350]|nr:hypothetical protein OCEANICA350_12884 [Oceanicaulis sp. 350]